MNNAKGVIARDPAIPLSNVAIQAAETAKQDVLASAGATLPTRDAVDRRVAREVNEGRGRIIDSPSDVGGYPVYSRGTPARDSDNDGLPDVWEEAHGLDKSRANANGRHLDPNYDNIEVYINGLFGPSGRP